MRPPIYRPTHEELRVQRATARAQRAFRLHVQDGGIEGLQLRSRVTTVQHALDRSLRVHASTHIPHFTGERIA